MLVASLALPAQDVTATAALRNSTTVSADCALGTNAQQSRPAGTNADALALAAAANGPYGTSAATLTTSRLLGLAGPAWQVTFTGDATATGSPPLAPLLNSAGLSQFDVLVTFTATAPVQAEVVVTWHETMQLSGLASIWGGAGAGAGADVGNDGTWEIANPTAPTTVSVPIAFGPGAFQVRVAMNTLLTATAVAGQGGASAHAVQGFDVAVLPGYGCSVTDQGFGCGIALAGQPNFAGAADLVASGLVPPTAGLGALVYGLQPATLPLPLPPGCLLRTTTDAVRILIADPAGRAGHRLAIPPAFQPFAVYAQAAWFDATAGTLATSNRLLVAAP